VATSYAGGRLDSAGATIGRVRLTLNDGSQLEGIADVSLFIGRQRAPPESVEIYAPVGVVLSTKTRTSHFPRINGAN
jgi:hypothetical protein